MNRVNARHGTTGLARLGALNAVAALLSACASGQPLAVRLAAALRALRDGLPAGSLAVGLDLPEGPWVLAREGDGRPNGAGLALFERWRLWIDPPGHEEEGSLLALGRFLLGRELERELERSRALRASALQSAFHHELGNALTPLLCHASDGVVKDAIRVRAVLDLARQLGGRGLAPPGLLTAGGFLERVRRIGAKLAGAPELAVEVEPGAAGRALGGEQRELLALLLHALASLSGAPEARPLLRVGAGPDGLVLELVARVAPPPPGLVDLPELPGVRVSRTFQADGLSLRLAPRSPPRAVVLGGPDLVLRLERALSALGLRLSRAADASEAVALLEADPGIWAVLVEEREQAASQALRRLMSERRLPQRAHLPLLLLGPDLRPRFHQAGPDEVDLCQVLGAWSDASASRPVT